MKRIIDYTIVAESFTLGSPAQQLYDRVGGGVWCSEGKFLLQRDVKALPSLETAVQSATDLIVVEPAEATLKAVLETRASGGRMFVYGDVTAENLRLAQARNIQLCSGTVFSTLLQLPPIRLPQHARLRDTLMIGNLSAVDALLAVTDREPLKIESVRVLKGAEVWAARERDWSARLLAAAVSRSDKIQGNTLLDGRTEDVVALGLLEGIAKSPTAYIINFTNKSRAAVLVIEDAILDLVTAVETASTVLHPSRLFSTQLFQSPSPQQHHYDRLVDALQQFFDSGIAPWRARRSRLRAELLEKIRK